MRWLNERQFRIRLGQGSFGVTAPRLRLDCFHGIGLIHTAAPQRQRDGAFSIDANSRTLTSGTISLAARFSL